MTLGEAIVQTANADATLVQLIGARLYPVRPPSGADLPNVVYQRIAASPATTHNEASDSQHDLVQFTVTASTYEECEAVAASLKAAFDNQSVGNFGRASFDDERDVENPAPDLFSVSLDFLI